MFDGYMSSDLDQPASLAIVRAERAALQLALDCRARMLGQRGPEPGDGKAGKHAEPCTYISLHVYSTSGDTGSRCNMISHIGAQADIHTIPQYDHVL